ncbi:MAG TPA: methyltransferase domain-containing protein [Iamia sp.]
MTAPPEDDAWAELAPAFVDGHYGSLRGRVRTHVVAAHLRHHLAPPPGRIVDVGGGAGTQSIPLARAGYDVTIVDPSAAMLARAEAAVAAEDDATQARVRLVEATGEDAPAALDDATFDGVLCHGVLMYLDDPRPLVAALCALAGPGGVVSVVAKNVEVMAVLPVLRGEWAAALAAFDEDRQLNGLGLETRGDSIETLERALAGHGVTPLAWYGVRLFTDGWLPQRPATDPEDEVLAVELEASRRDPYRRLSRLFHLVGQRR